MNVSVLEKPRLEDGRHIVTITEVSDGKGEYKSIPFFSTAWNQKVAL